MASVLMQRGEKMLLPDNLANSSSRVLDRMEQLSGKRPVFVEGDIRDRALLQKVCHEQTVGAVIHFAGLKAVRGSGEAAIESVVQARKAGPFTDLFDFCARIDRRQVNRRTIDALSQDEGH